MNQMRPHSECKATLGKNTFYLFEAKIPHETEEKLNYHPILKGKKLKRKKIKERKKLKRNFRNSHQNNRKVCANLEVEG